MVVQATPTYTSVSEEMSFDILLANSRSRLIRFCARLTGNPGVAEDLAQETLLEAWRNQQKLSNEESADEEGRVKWLLAIARNICLRWGRSHGRDLAHLAQYTLSAASDDEQELELDGLPASVESLDIELERDELAQLLDRALALLPPTTRSVLIERYIHESPHREISERLGLSEDALVQRLYRGKLALRRVMENELNAEAAAYGLVDPLRPGEPGALEQETRIWCPICNQHRLTKYYDPARNVVGFTCPGCWHFASQLQSPLWAGLRNPKAILNRQLVSLGEYYWQAINEGSIVCPDCGCIIQARIVAPQDIPEAFYSMHRSKPYHGVSLRCGEYEEDINLLPLLSIDVPEAQQFWRTHPRMTWLPEREIDYAGQPALLSGFQSASDSARLDIVYQRETLRILGIHETTC